MKKRFHLAPPSVPNHGGRRIAILGWSPECLCQRGGGSEDHSKKCWTLPFNQETTAVPAHINPGAPRGYQWGQPVQSPSCGPGGSHTGKGFINQSLISESALKWLIFSIVSDSNYKMELHTVTPLKKLSDTDWFSFILVTVNKRKGFKTSLQNNRMVLSKQPISGSAALYGNQITVATAGIAETGIWLDT